MSKLKQKALETLEAHIEYAESTKKYMDVGNFLLIKEVLVDSIPSDEVEDAVSSILKVLEEDPSALAVSIRATLNRLIRDE